MAERKSVEHLVEQLQDLEPHTVQRLSVALNVSAGTVRNLRNKATKQGWRIIWTSEGYMLIPTQKVLKDKMLIVKTLNWVALITSMQEAWERKAVEARELKQLIDPTLLATVYKEPIKEHVPYLPGKFLEMKNHLSVIHRDLLKAMPYHDEFLKTRYWSVVRAEVSHRETGTCQLCDQAEGTDCHHTTYDHHGWEDEHLDELMWVCRPCHEILEAQKNG